MALVLEEANPAIEIGPKQKELAYKAVCAEFAGVGPELAAGAYL